MDDKNVRVSPIEVQKYLSGVEYPATKDDLVQRAQDNDASQEVFNMLNELPDRQYDSPAEVSREIGNIE